MPRLNSRVSIQRAKESIDDGHVSTTWETFKTVWCNYRLRNRDYYTNGVYVEERRAVFEMWQDDAIALNHRIVLNNVAYEITDIQPAKARNKMEIMGRKVQS